MAGESLKNKTLSGIIWSAVNRFAQQGLAFVFNILIARQLMPSDYGVIAMLAIFLDVSRAFIDSGFANALIRYKERTEKDYNTVFYFNVAISVAVYALLFFAAPFISRFYDQPLLTKVTRIVGLTLIITAIGAIQSTVMTIRIDFKLRAKISIVGSFIAGSISLLMAYRGYGLWALVWQQIINCSMGTILCWLWVRWRPQLVFSWTSFRNLFSYGSKILLSGLLNTVYNNLSTLIVGKVYSSSDLGEYSKARSLSQFPSSTITSVMQSVTFPVLSSIQDQQERLAKYYKQFINLSSYVIFPIMVGLAAEAEPLVNILLTDKWSGMVPLLQICCFAFMWHPVHAINLNLLQVLGRSDYFLKLEVWKKALGLCVLLATVPFGIVAICLGQVLMSVVSLFINTYYTKKLIGYGFSEQMRNLFHILVHSLIMGALAYMSSRLMDSHIAQLLVGVTVGALYYFCGAYMLKFPEQKELIGIIREKLKF